MITKIGAFFKDPFLPIWTSIYLDVLGIMLLSPFLPRFILDYGASVTQVGLILSINSFIGFFSSILWGRLSDRFGRKRILVICRLGSMAGFLLLAFAQNLTLVIISRVIDGLFSRGIIITLTVVADRIPASRRSREMSKVGTAWIFGGLAGPAIGALLLSAGLAGLAVFCAGLTLLAILITIVSIKDRKLSLPHSLSDAVGAEPSKATVLATSLLKQYNPRLLLTRSLVLSLAHFIFSTTVPLYMTTRFAFSNAQIGWLLASAGLINLALRLFGFPLLFKKFGDQKIFEIGAFVYLLAFVWLTFLESIWMFFIVYVLVSFATTFSVDLMNGLMSHVVSRKQLGEMIGLNSAVENVSLVLGPIIGSALISLTIPAFYGLAPAASSLAVIMLGLIPLRKTKTENI